MPPFSPLVPSLYHGRGTLDLVAGGNPSSRSMGVLVEPGGNSLCHVAHLSTRGAQRGPYLSGQFPVVVHFWNLCQLLPPVRHIESMSLPGYPSLIFLCWGFWAGIISAILPHTAGHLLGKAVHIWSQLWWQPQVKRHFSPFILPRLLGPTGEGCAQGNGQGCPLAKPCDISCFVPGTFSLVVTILRVGMGIWPASGDGLAQPLYLLLQGSCSC